MGGVAATTAAGLEVKNLLDSNKLAAKETRRQQRTDLANRKNLLEEQLAKRRASFGAMGINSSGLAEASRKKMLDDFRTDYKNANAGYGYKLADLEAKKISALTSQSGRMIK